jgi:hypothetical protein
VSCRPWLLREEQIRRLAGGVLGLYLFRAEGCRTWNGKVTVHSGRKSKRRLALARYQICSCIFIFIFIFHHIASIDYHLLSRALPSPLLGRSTCRVMKCHQHQDYQERESSANLLRAWQPALLQLLRPPGVLHAVDDGTVACEGVDLRRSS